MSQRFSLDGKVVFVTGSTRGLGLATAKACAESGANVIVHGRKAERAEARARELADLGYFTDHLAFELEDRAAVESAIPTILERHGAIWGLVNNAGMVRHEDLGEARLETLEAVMAVHMHVPFLLTQSAVTAMLKNSGPDRGRVLNIASIAVMTPRTGITNYTAAKGAVVGFTRATAAELGGHGIRCNAIAPGYFVTDINRERLADPAFADKVNRCTPAGRWGDPVELGGPAVFLLSPASSYVNGQVLYVDGGMSHFLPSS